MNKLPEGGTFLTRKILRGFFPYEKMHPRQELDCFLNKAGRLSMSVHQYNLYHKCFVNRALSDSTKMQSFSAHDQGREKVPGASLIIT